jgi:DNA-directed RNA polymerase subunit delta
MGGYQVPGRFPNDEGYDEEGYDESQRAEILEATTDGPSDGVILTDIAPDIGDEDEDGETIDDLDMEDNEEAAVDPTVDSPAEDIEEDELQDDFDNDALGDDADRDDADNAALEP